MVRVQGHQVQARGWLVVRGPLFPSAWYKARRAGATWLRVRLERRSLLGLVYYLALESLGHARICGGICHVSLLW